MARVSIVEALAEPGKRQEYMDGLVDTVEGDLRYVLGFEYLSDEVIREFAVQDFGMSPLALNLRLSFCEPQSTDGNLGQFSNIYQTHTLYEGLKKHQLDGLAEPEEIDHLLRISLVDHQYTHAEHYMDGIPGFVDKISNDHESKLFETLSQLESHRRSIIELGKLGVESDYLSNHKAAQFEEYSDHFRRLQGLLESKNDPALVRKAIDKYSKLEANVVKRRSDQLGITQIII